MKADVPNKQSRRTALVLLAVAALTFGSAPARPQDAGDALPAGVNGYTVEIIVFRGGTGGTGEDLSTAARETTADSDTAAAGTSRTARLLTVLPAGQRKLSDVAGRINSSGSYRTIAHVAWTQTASAWNSHSGLSAEQLGLNAAGLTGLVQLERGQYMHLGFNLQYAAPGGARYAMTTSRRVRFGERNYFDHPGFGIIAVVTAGTAAGTAAP